MSNPDTTQQQLDQLVGSVCQLGTRLDQLTTALDTIAAEFVRPVLKQAYENQQAITALIESNQRHQEWLDDDRRDINTLRAETTAQITTLIEQANADRKVFADRFDSMLSEIRHNQRMILAQGQRLEASSARQDALLAEVLSLSRRVQSVEDAA